MRKYCATVQVSGIAGESPRAVRAALNDQLRNSGLPNFQVVKVDIDPPPPVVRPPVEPAQSPPPLPQTHAGGFLLAAAASWAILFFWWMLFAASE